MRDITQSSEREADDRFTLIETKLLYLENFSSQLHDVVLAQAQIIEQLQVEFRLCKSKLSAFEDALGGTLGAMPADEKPPHY